MNAPTQPTTLLVDHGKLRPSPTNPRTRSGLDEASLTKLAETMAPPFGIAQPILVRERVEVIDGSEVSWLEIIAGERRWRAAKIAGLEQVPVIIKPLADHDVVGLQLIENLGREDLSEIEEAEGYEKMLQQLDADGKKYTVEAIAKMAGVSKGTIYARLKLLDLCPEGRDALHAGKMDASTALLIARIPVHKLQIEALKEVTATMTYDWEGGGKAKGDKVLSYRAARTILQDRYMLDLADAPFDPKDADLVPKAGNCTDCTKRTGNQPDIFDDVGSKDVCTDPVCHAMKKTAHVLALQKAAEEKGNKLLLGKDAKKLIPNYMKTPEEHLKDHGLVPLDAKVPGDEQKRTFGQILKEAKLLTPAKDTGKATVSKTIVEHPHRANTMIETVSIEAATKALREAGFEITMKGQEDTRKKDEEKRAKEREKEKQELAIENAFRGRLFDTLHARIEADMLDPKSDTFPKLYRMLAVQLWEYGYGSTEDTIALMRKYTSLPNKQEGEEIDWASHIDEFGENLPNLTPAQHLMLIIELSLFAEELTAGEYSGEAGTMLKLAKELDIDAAVMRKEAAAEHKAAAAAAKKAEKPAAKKPAGKAKKAEVAPTLPSLLADTTPPKVRPAATWPFPTPL